MEPIQDLLNRIRWDPKFGAARFLIGYHDRVTGSIVKVPLEALSFEAHDHFAFKVIGEDGLVHNVPLHRVREVYRDGDLIWHRHS